MEDGEINVEETNVGVEKSYFSYIFEVKRKEEKRTKLENSVCFVKILKRSV